MSMTYLNDNYSQRVCALLSWPVSKAQLGQALNPPTPEPTSPSKKPLINIIDFIHTKHFNHPPPSGPNK